MPEEVGGDLTNRILSQSGSGNVGMNIVHADSSRFGFMVRGFPLYFPGL
jgi:hypothetical protein